MNKELLFQLYAIHSPSNREKKMRKFVKRYIRAIDGITDITQDAFGNIFVTKGTAETYPCLASHIDQVQRSHSKDFECVDGKDVVFGYSAKAREQQGLGADDKNGIYICLECLRRFPAIKCAFFVGEEIGCVGSSQCDLTFFNDCRYVIEPDRRGGSDLITSMYVGEVCSADFIAAIGAERFGYRPAQGSITDVGTLVERGIGISCLNLSCGYYEAHTDTEFTVLSELQNCLDFVCHIVETLTEVYPHQYVNPWSSYRTIRSGKGASCSCIGDSWKEEDYYDWHSDSDYDMMENIMRSNPELTFDELTGAGGWTENFFTRDTATLRDLYYSVCEMNGYGEFADDGELMFELDESHDDMNFNDIKLSPLRKVS